MQRVVLDGVDVVLRDDGILEYRYTTRQVVDIDLARRAVEGARALGGDRARPSMVWSHRVAGLTRAARTFFADSPENAAITSRAALMIDSPLARAIGSFMLGMNRPRMPTRLFTDEKEAVAWLLAEA